MGIAQFGGRLRCADTKWRFVLRGRTMGRLDGKVAVITGGSQGLGLALARGLGQRGWALVLDARRADRLERAVDELASITSVVGVVGDVTDGSHRDALVASAQGLGRRPRSRT